MDSRQLLSKSLKNRSKHRRCMPRYILCLQCLQVKTNNKVWSRHLTASPRFRLSPQPSFNKSSSTLWASLGIRQSTRTTHDLAQSPQWWPTRSKLKQIMRDLSRLFLKSLSCFRQISTWEMRLRSSPKETRPRKTKSSPSLRRICIWERRLRCWRASLAQISKSLRT